MKHIAIFFVWLYRKLISPIKPPTCRFTPTCSQYAMEAFKKRGFFAGLILTTYRIIRCNPFSRGGYDPVPERGFKPYGGKKVEAQKEEPDEVKTPCAEEKKIEKEKEDKV